MIHVHDLPEKLHNATAAVSTNSQAAGVTLEELERDHMRRMLKQLKGDKVRAAQILGIHLSTLYRKMQHYHLENKGLQPPSDKSAIQAV